MYTLPALTIDELYKYRWRIEIARGFSRITSLPNKPRSAKSLFVGLVTNLG
jgi:hypothetical protein